ncbi:MAG TPA: TOBE domain-containing protein [Noviherbaspirillum sp.]|nr:TOBE domain-containing protein [Noviherbaspirillum sp.]
MNRLPAKIAAVDVHGSIALVDAAVDAHRFTAMLIGAADEVKNWTTGMPVTLLFKETEVSLAKNLSGLLSMRNRIPCTVTAVEHGKLLTKVSLNFNGNLIESIITTRSSHALSIAPGDIVEGLVKANEMTVIAEDAT